MGPGPQAPFVDPAVSVLAQGRIGPAAAYLQARRAALSFLERNCRGRYPDQRQDRRWNVVIGTNCTIFQQVTIGDVRRCGQEGKPVPVIGNNVEIGAGAKVLGGIRVGDGAKIGANAVVLQDVPPGAIAVGIPARIKRVVPCLAGEHGTSGFATLARPSRPSDVESRDAFGPPASNSEQEMTGRARAQGQARGPRRT